MSKFEYRWGVVGAGNMATAMLRGAFSKGVLRPQHVIASRRNAERRAALRDTLGISVTGENAALIRRSAIVLLALKPQQASAFLAEHGDEFVAGQVLVSVLAGTTTGTLRAALPTGVTVVRTMPNTPALVGRGVTLVSGDPMPQAVTDFLDASGTVETVDESKMDHATAISGCGPAYVFLLAEALAGAGTDLGLDGEQSRRLAYDTLVGAALLLDHSAPEVDAAELRRRVTSPGGATEAALRVFEARGLRQLVADAARAGQRRATELGGDSDPMS